jgi:DNA polymerase epsilon subunit 1
MTLNKAQTAGLNLEQVDRASDSTLDGKYLNEGTAGNYVFLYHACSASAPVHVFGLFLPNGTVKLHIVDPAPRRQPIPRLSETYSSLLQTRTSGSSVSISYPATQEFTSVYHNNDVTALKAISRELGLLENQSFTVVISSSKDQSYFDAFVPKLVKFPVLTLSQTKAAHTLDVFPWQSSVAKKMLARYLYVGEWLDRMIALADYYDVPVGNIEGDQPLFLSDVEFARRLIKQDMVLWWSPGEQPDLGGVQDDKRPIEDLQSSEFLSPGCYSNVCLEVAVRNLAVNSVLHSVVVNELEGSGGTTAFDSSHTLDEFAGGDTQRPVTLGESNMSPQAFSIMRGMVKTWLLDKIQRNPDSPATIAIDHFWRWISSNISHMYDSAIHRFIHGLMRKTFIQMLAEFKRLGSHVVYADFSRLLLVTSKPPGTAHAYATYITTAVTSHELFQHIYLRTEKFYDFLLFMDEANLGGIVCEDPLALEAPEEICMEMRWNIETFLPQPIQKDFSNLVRYFIVEMYKTRQKSSETSRVPLRILHNAAMPDATQRDAGRIKEMEATREFLARRLTRRLLKGVGNAQDRFRDAMMDEATLAEWGFPLLPGSYLHLTNPALELVKFVCAVLALAKEYHVEVGLIKRNLLELVGIREFANEAVFHNPCEPLKLSSVPCQHCDGIRDFDFCRDPELFPNNLDINVKWLCTRCESEYDRTGIELTLMEMVHDLERQVAQQDLRCSKCKQLQGDNISKHCHCSGSYQLTTSKADVKRRLRTVVNVAIVHNLGRLKVCFLI